MKRKEALSLPEYDNYVFEDLARRYIHKETDQDVVILYFCRGKSIMEIAEELQRKTNRIWSTRQIWTIKNESGAYLFDLYDKLYGAK